MRARARLLVVDDDPVVAESLAEFFRREGCETVTAFDSAEALTRLDETAGEASQRIQVVFCDVGLPGPGGLELLRTVTQKHPETVCVMITGYGTIETAVEALRLGAVDFLTKPVVDQELRVALERALRQQALMSENRRLRRKVEDRSGMPGVIGSDERMRKINDLVHAVAASRTTVLMNGESGVGKSLVARTIHELSPRKDMPFIELACGSIPETLLESELFGHVKGAFTGAHADKIGRFFAANGGTIFLDEINSASPAMQLKLLRVLQERKFEPVGSSETVEVDVRVLLAANESLEDLVADGRFREDLYYRVNVVAIEVPPLRERVGDVMTLAEHFLERQGAELGRVFAGFAPEAGELLRRYAFPGNVRELQNIVERAAVLSRGPTIGADDLPETVRRQSPSLGLTGASTPGAGESLVLSGEPTTLADALLEPERVIILAALQRHEWNRQQTADELGINRTTLYKKMKQHGIESEERLAS
ncbi:MAG: DNA-binding NtrC family response regulator [Phycisphaerales bacterium]